MQLRNYLLVSLTSLAFISHVAANSFGVPEKPSITSPTHGSADVSLAPLFEASEFEIKLDDESTAVDSTFTKSEFLVLEQTDVTIVGGSSLTGSDLEQSDGTLYDISDQAFTLDGLPVGYILVNYKRIEALTQAGTLVGIAELPEFMWQAENRDRYQAMRMKRFVDGVVVEWHYGDSTAAQPWDLKVQAILQNGKISLKFDELSFNASIITSYGNESVQLCGGQVCYSHSLVNIYNSGNTIECALPNVESHCRFTNIYPSVDLSNLEVNEVAYIQNVQATSFKLNNPLNNSQTYQVLTRQSGSLPQSQDIFSSWSDALTFTTSIETKDVQAEWNINLTQQPINENGEIHFEVIASEISGVGEIYAVAEITVYDGSVGFPSSCRMIDRKDTVATVFECDIILDGPVTTSVNIPLVATYNLDRALSDIVYVRVCNPERTQCSVEKNFNLNLVAQVPDEPDTEGNSRTSGSGGGSGGGTFWLLPALVIMLRRRQYS